MSDAGADVVADAAAREVPPRQAPLPVPWHIRLASFLSKTMEIPAIVLLVMMWTWCVFRLNSTRKEFERVFSEVLEEAML